MISRLIFIIGTCTLSLLGNKSFCQDQKDTVNNGTFYEPFEVWPQFPGGAEKLKEFIKSNLKKVDSATGKRLIAVFVVEKDGSLTDIRIVRGINEEADKEAIRVLKLSPKWKPGSQNGIVLRVAYSIPITFN